MRKIYEIDDATMMALRKALEAAVIKAALDGRRKDKAAYEDALKDVNATLVGQLSDRPACITCHLTIGELIDIRIALDAFIKDPNNVCDEGWHKLRARANTTIALNTGTKS